MTTDPHQDDHGYFARIVWTGNTGAGTASYDAYSRDHDVIIADKPVIKGSSDPAFRGDALRHNPEDLLVASLSSCHMLWYLHLASQAGIVVETYADDARGWMAMGADSGGEFTEVILNPRVTLSAGDEDLALALHEKAHSLCFIARSMNFPVRCEASIKTA